MHKCGSIDGEFGYRAGAQTLGFSASEKYLDKGFMLRYSPTIKTLTRGDSDAEKEHQYCDYPGP